eukprot:gene57311-biopygen58078
MGCTDRPLPSTSGEWQDSFGYNCANYTSSGLCACCGGSNSYANEGLTANTACCGCGEINNTVQVFHAMRLQIRDVILQYDMLVDDA